MVPRKFFSSAFPKYQGEPRGPGHILVICLYCVLVSPALGQPTTESPKHISLARKSHPPHVRGRCKGVFNKTASKVFGTVLMQR